MDGDGEIAMHNAMLDGKLVKVAHATPLNNTEWTTCFVAALLYLHPLFYFARTMGAISIGRRSGFCLQQTAAR